jgi:DNA-binding transcriptional regulator YdaS (Cro superfamily)
MARQTRIRDPGLEEAIEVAGIGGIAKLCGISPQAVSQWDIIPHNRVLVIEAGTNIPRERLRPDLYGAPRPRPRRRQILNAAA